MFRSKARRNRLVVLLDPAERQAIEGLAEAEKLPLSTLARARLLQEAEDRGFWPLREESERIAA